MKVQSVGWLAIVLVIGLGVFLSAQPGEEPGKGGKKGPPDGKKGPPTFELGKVLPPFIRDQIELSEGQQKQIAALEEEVREKLQKILSEEQLKKIRQGRGPKGPPDDKGKDKSPKGKGDKGPGKILDRPALEDSRDRGSPRPNAIFLSADDFAFVGGLYRFLATDAETKRM